MKGSEFSLKLNRNDEAFQRCRLIRQITFIFILSYAVIKEICFHSYSLVVKPKRKISCFHFLLFFFSSFTFIHKYERKWEGNFPNGSFQYTLHLLMYRMLMDNHKFYSWLSLLLHSVTIYLGYFIVWLHINFTVCGWKSTQIHEIFRQILKDQFLLIDLYTEEKLIYWMGASKSYFDVNFIYQEKQNSWSC